MMADGLVEETKSLLDSGLSLDAQSMRSIGYRQIVWYLQGQMDKLAAVEKLKQANVILLNANLPGIVRCRILNGLIWKKSLCMKRLLTRCSKRLWKSLNCGKIITIDRNYFGGESYE